MKNERGRLIWEDGASGVFNKKGIRWAIVILVAIYSIFIIMAVLTGFFSFDTFLNLTAIFSFASFIILLGYFRTIKTSNNVKIHENGIEIKIEKSPLTLSMFTIVAERIFLPLEEIDNIGLVFIYRYTPLPSQKSYELILSVKGGQILTSRLLNKEGFLEALKRVRFNKIEIRK